MELVKEIWEFFLEVVNNWAGYATGGLVVAILWLWSKYQAKDIPRKWALALAALFLFAAFFKAWQKQYTRSQSESVYVETHLEPSIPDAQHILKSFLQPGSRINAKFLHTRTGQDIATDVVTAQNIYIEPDNSLDTQKRVTQDLQRRLEKKIADNTAQAIEGPTLGYSNDTQSVWGSAPIVGPILTRPLFSQVWDGSRNLLYVSAVSYRTLAGQRYESHFCVFLQPPNLNSPHPGEPMPDDPFSPDTQLSFVTCDTYNSPVKKK
jgi:hypothetical protein